jgi:hypothetical protein
MERVYDTILSWAESWGRILSRLTCLQDLSSGENIIFFFFISTWRKKWHRKPRETTKVNLIHSLSSWFGDSSPNHNKGSKSLTRVQTSFDRRDKRRENQVTLWIKDCFWINWLKSKVKTRRDKQQQGSQEITVLVEGLSRNHWKTWILDPNPEITSFDICSYLYFSKFPNPFVGLFDQNKRWKLGLKIRLVIGSLHLPSRSSLRLSCTSSLVWGSSSLKSCSFEVVHHNILWSSSRKHHFHCHQVYPHRHVTFSQFIFVKEVSKRILSLD